MDPLVLSGIVLVVVFTGGAIGLQLQRALPEDWTTGGARDMTGAVVGLVTLLLALVLGLLIWSAYGRVVMFAGHRYREFLVEPLERRGIKVDAGSLAAAIPALAPLSCKSASLAESSGFMPRMTAVRLFMNRLLIGWSAYFGYGSRLPAYRAVDHHVHDRVRHFLARRHKEPGRGVRRFPYAKARSASFWCGISTPGAYANACIILDVRQFSPSASPCRRRPVCRCCAP